MAIKILEENGYISKQLAYADGVATPMILQDAKRGKHNITKADQKEVLLDYLQQDKDDRAFGLLITELCNTNRLLHDVFGRIDDYTEILLPQNLLQSDGLLELINSEAIAAEDYQEVELIGWLYQFYISDRKDEVFAGFKKNKKARAEDIPAATQIFTPKWIVKYMVENTIGKLYLDYEADSSLKDQMKYLVENKGAEPAKAIITDITELTLLDPACGSGHILVVGFDLLFKMYREEGYSAKQAVQSILKNNLYGLDIDDRAMQLARFAVLLKAAQFDASILDSGLLPHVYSFPEDTIGRYFNERRYQVSSTNLDELIGMKASQPISFTYTEKKVDRKTKKEKLLTVPFKRKAGDVLSETALELIALHGPEEIALDYSEELELFWGDHPKGADYSSFFYTMDLLRQGKNLGSALKPLIHNDALEHVAELYKQWVTKEESGALDIYQSGIWQKLKPFLDVMLVLGRTYTAVVANPPYMGRKGMNAQLKDYVNTHYPTTKSDLFAVFMEVCLGLCQREALMGMINQHSWMFLSSYERLRNRIISQYGIVNMLHLGPRTFEELSGEVVQSTAFVIQNKPNRASATYFRLVNYRHNTEKETQFLAGNNRYANIPQSNFFNIPGSPFAYWVSIKTLEVFTEYPQLKDIVATKQGMATGDNDTFLRYWPEIDCQKFNPINESLSEALNGKFKWYPYNKGGDFKKWYGNYDIVISFDEQSFDVLKNQGNKCPSRNLYFRAGLTWTLLVSNTFGARIQRNHIFDVNGLSAFPDEELYDFTLGLFWCNRQKGGCF